MSFELRYGGDLQNALQAAEIYADMRPEPYTEFFLPALIHLRMGSDDHGIELMEAYAANRVEQDNAEKNAVLGFIERAAHLAVYRQDQSWIYRSIGYAAAGRAELATKEINQYRERAWINGDSVLLDIIERNGISVPRAARQGSKAHIDKAIAAYVEKLRVDIDLVD